MAASLVSSVLIASVLLRAGYVRAADDAYFRIVPIDASTGFAVGRGYDILSGNPRGDCVTRTTDPIDTVAAAQDNIRFQSTEITNSRELAESLGISASAQLQAGLGSASASASFARSVSVQQYSLSYFVKASLETQSARLRDVRLMPQYEALLKSNAADRFARFRRSCGDGFIGELVAGGEFTAVVSIETSSTSEREAISAKIGGSYAAFSGWVEFSKTVQSSTAGKKVTVASFRRGGNGAPIAVKLEDIPAQVAALPASTEKASVPIKAAVYSYLTLLADPGIELQDFVSREATIRDYAAVNAEADERISDLNYLIGHPTEFQFSPFDFPKLADELAATKAVKATLLKLSADCFNNNGTCKRPSVSLPNTSVRPARK